MSNFMIPESVLCGFLKSKFGNIYLCAGLELRDMSFLNLQAQGLLS